MTSHHDPFSARRTLRAGAAGDVTLWSLPALATAGLGDVSRLPFSIRVLLEAALRNLDGYVITEADVQRIAGWSPSSAGQEEIPFLPGRVVLQDFTGVPCVVDLAAMRAAMQRLGGDPAKINPLVPCDLVIDHSVQVDHFGSPDAYQRNLEIEFERNRERYEFLKWGQRALRNFRCVPPGTGIVHQVNLEYLAGVVLTREVGGARVAFPDSLVGTDSHTTMVNGLGVVGWGVGGIEAEAVMLGQPVYMLMPEVVGFELRGRLPEGTTATDLVLTVTQMLRQKGVVGKFVEFWGDGLRQLSLADRATIANMAPEYGATMGFFPVDDETLAYLRLTGRDAAQIELVERYTKEQGLFWTAGAPTPTYSDGLALDLASIEPCLAGPKRPQDRVTLSAMRDQFRSTLRAPLDKRGFALGGPALEAQGRVPGTGAAIGHGAVVIAAITSCTNTSNPDVLVAAGLVARKARQRGLTVPPWVKTSLAPGSRVVTDYLQAAGLAADLDALGFHNVGYGCTTCIGNSGPLPDPVRAAIQEGDLVAASVLSGNRNFEGRVNQDVKANYLASPPLVVAYALAGTVDKDLRTEPLGTDTNGKEVFLKDIWPTTQEVRDTVRTCVRQDMFRERYASLEGPAEWQAIHVAGDSQLYQFKASSTYIQEPPFFLEMAHEPEPVRPIEGARCLVKVGDSTTTDHISPAGSIKPDSPAGRYLQQHGVEPADFNSYGARRGNDRVMTRGTFANIRLRNQLAPGTEGGVTTHLPSGEVTSIYEASQRYQQAGTPLLVLAGKEYGTGSSRDWAAKGTNLLGVRCVLAESYERIHRSNLVGMGVLPLQFQDGETAASLGLTGREVFDIDVDDHVAPRQLVAVRAVDPDRGTTTTFQAVCRIDTPVEVDYYRNGGILHTVLRRLSKD
ncbi:MAG: aconitate hydratase AcnA [Planctomycetes bacterium]|nr:aconitate hydratase AcnA [Planctomycetota bacterium]